jgi:uncharacterized membrane protein YdcZ (DUF606 family)
VSKEVAVLATVVAGGLVAAQAPANNVLSDRLGTWGAVSVNFVVGTICVLTITFALLGLDERAVTWEKLIGIALLAAGTVLVVRE